MISPRCPHCRSPLSAQEQTCPACGRSTGLARVPRPAAAPRPARRLALLAAVVLLVPLLSFLALRGAGLISRSDQGTATAIAAATPGGSQTPAPQSTIQFVDHAAQRLRIHQLTYPELLDPQRASFSHELSVLGLIYEGLTRIDERLGVVPAAAERWEFSPDTTMVTFTLRGNLTYSDGAGLTAHHFEAALRRALDPNTGGEYQYLLFDIVGAEELASTPLTDTAAIEAAYASLGITAVDDYTLVFHLKGPGLHFPAIMSTHIAYPNRLVGSADDAYFDPARHIGNGPFVLASLKPDQRITFTANLRYWRGRPRLSEIEYRYIVDSGAALADYQEGRLDIVQLEAHQAQTILNDRSQKELAAELVHYAQAATIDLAFNLTRPPFDDLNVRRAFAYAFDREIWCAQIRADCVPALAWIPAGLPGAYDEMRYAFDPDKAREALAQSKYANAMPEIRLAYNSDNPATKPRVEWLAGEIQKHLGITLILEPNESKPLVIMRKDVSTYPQLTFSGWIGDYPDPYNWMDTYWACDSEYAQAVGYCNQELDALLAQAGAQPDPVARAEIYVQAGKLLVEDAPAIFTHNLANFFLVKPSVTGYSTTAQDYEWPGQTASLLTIGTLPEGPAPTAPPDRTLPTEALAPTPAPVEITPLPTHTPAFIVDPTTPPAVTIMPAEPPLPAGSPVPTATPRLEPGRGVLRVHQLAFPETIDPHRAASAQEVAVAALLYEGLTRLDANLQVVPGAAERWEVSADGTKVTFVLREGLTFSDGTPLTAALFAESIRHALLPDVGGAYQYLLFDIKGAETLAGLPKSDGKTEVETDIALGILAPDERTLIFKLTRPSPAFPAIMSHPISYPIDLALLRTRPDERLALPQHIGNGPWVISAATPGDRIVFTPNARYHGGQPALGSIEYHYIADPFEALEAYRRGELDIMQPDVSDLPMIAEDATLRHELLQYPHALTRDLSFNLAKPPFDDLNLRRAFAYAFDRETWCYAIRNGECAPTLSWIPAGLPGAYEEERYAFDPARAREALAQSKYANAMPEITLSFSLDNPANKPRAEWIAGEILAHLGISIRLEIIEEGQPLDAQTYPQLTFGGWTAGYPDPQAWLDAAWRSSSAPAQLVGYHNAQLDDLLDRAAVELDPGTRAALYVQAGQALVDDVPAVFTDNRVGAFLVKPYVSGYHVTAQDTAWPGQTASELTIRVER